MTTTKSNSYESMKSQTAKVLSLTDRELKQKIMTLCRLYVTVIIGSYWSVTLRCHYHYDSSQ